MITYIQANNGSLEFFAPGWRYVGTSTNVKETALIIDVYGIESGCSLSSSMDFADEYGFPTYHAAKDILYTALYEGEDFTAKA